MVEITDKANEPAVVLVHGAWHTPEHYAEMEAALTDAGFLTVVPRLPTVNGDKPPTTTLSDDVVTVREEATKLISQGHPLLVLCHSYGGMVVTDAFTPDMHLEARKKNGLPGGIVHLIYMCAFLPQNGQSLATIKSASGENLETVIDYDDHRSSFPKDPVNMFYGELNPDAADMWTSKLITHSGEAHYAEITNTAWSYFPVTYLYCEEDAAIPLAAQHSMVDAVVATGSQKVRTKSYKAAHSPFLSIPDKVAALVKDTWESMGIDSRVVLLGS